MEQGKVLLLFLLLLFLLWLSDLCCKISSLFFLREKKPEKSVHCFFSGPFLLFNHDLLWLGSYSELPPQEMGTLDNQKILEEKTFTIGSFVSVLELFTT